MQNWGALSFAQESRTAQSDVLCWEGGKTALEGRARWQTGHESEGSFLKQYVGDAGQVILKANLHSVSLRTLPRKVQLSISWSFYLYPCCTLGSLFLVQYTVGL